jgi:hypothetical protein
VGCVKVEEQHSGTIELLRQVAMYGWLRSKMDADDPRAKLLSLKKMAGVVDSVSPVVGLPVDVWDGGCLAAGAADDRQGIAPPAVDYCTTGRGPTSRVKK